jgi:hypothetical protein
MGTLATSTISLASVHAIWDNAIGSVNTLVLDLLPYMVPAMLLLGAIFIVWRVAKGYIGGLN